MKFKIKNSKLKILFALLASPISLFTSPIWAEYDMQLGTQPGYEVKDSTPTKPAIDPFANILATELLASKPTTYWQIVDISSTNVAKDLSAFLRDGLGRLELTTLILIAEESKQKLKEVINKRALGDKLKAIAEQYKLTYGALRQQAIGLKEKLVAEMKLKLENEMYGKRAQ